MSKTVLFQAIQFSISILFSSIYQSGPKSDGNKGVFHIPQSSSITGASPSDYLVSYPGHSLGESYLSTEMQSVYSVAPAN